jgi:hypothetical protein
MLHHFSFVFIQNILNFTPPGFKQSLNVKFPDSRLAVCEACKKNFKTRDICRVRNQHTTPPWTMAYICMTLDGSCLDEHGRYVDKPMICRMVEWQSYRAMTDFDKRTPVCALCKKTNRTRSFCRDRHKHRQLPWCTVYVLLSALDSADPSTVVAAPSQPIDANLSNFTEESKLRSTEATKDDKEADPLQLEGAAAHDRAASESPPVSVKDESSVAESKASDLSENISPGDDAKRMALLGVGDDINNIHESRTMLIKVATVGTVITWLEKGDDGQLLRRNLSNALDEHSPNPVAVCIPQAVNVVAGQQQQQQPVHDQKGFYWPMALGMLHPNTVQQHYFHQMQHRQQVQYGVVAWQHGTPMPQLPHQPQYQGGPVPPPHPQTTSAHYLPIIQHSPSASVSVPNTPIAASPPTTAPSPALHVTAGEAAAQHCFDRSLDAGLVLNPEPERRVSQSPAEPPMQPPIPRLQHSQVFVPYPTPPITTHAPPQLNPPTYHQEPHQQEQSLPQQHHAPPFQYQETWVPYQNSMCHLQQQTHLQVPQFPGVASFSSPIVPSGSTEDSVGIGPKEEVQDSTILDCSTGSFSSPGKRLHHQFPPPDDGLCLDGEGDAASITEEREKFEQDQNNLHCSKRSRLA